MCVDAGFQLRDRRWLKGRVGCGVELATLFLRRSWIDVHEAAFAALDDPKCALVAVNEIVGGKKELAIVPVTDHAVNGFEGCPLLSGGSLHRVVWVERPLGSG